MYAQIIAINHWVWFPHSPDIVDTFDYKVKELSNCFG